MTVVPLVKRKILEKVMAKSVMLSSQHTNTDKRWERGVLHTVNGASIAAGDDDEPAPTPRPNMGAYVGVAAKNIQGYRGPTTWYVFVLAQDVNTVPEGTDPREAAKTMGGILLTSGFGMKWKEEPCEMDYDAVVEVF
ncbi:hypothetical protein TWF281_004620 [Arthrobotrys megalospora]